MWRWRFLQRWGERHPPELKNPVTDPPTYAPVCLPGLAFVHGCGGQAPVLPPSTRGYYFGDEYVTPGTFGGGGSNVSSTSSCGSAGGGGGGGFSGGAPGYGGGSYGVQPFTSASVTNVFDGYVIAKLAVPTAGHAIDFTASPTPEDIGSVGGWAAVKSPQSVRTGAAATAVSRILAIVAYPPFWTADPKSTINLSVFDADGISLTIFPGTVQAAPGVNITGLGVLSNQNSGCNFAFFLDGASRGAATLLFGSAYPATPNNLASIVASFDAAGAPTATDGAGTPFAPVPFPPPPAGAPAGNVCAPATIGPRATILPSQTTSRATSSTSQWNETCRFVLKCAPYGAPPDFLFDFQAARFFLPTLLCSALCSPASTVI